MDIEHGMKELEEYIEFLKRYNNNEPILQEDNKYLVPTAIVCFIDVVINCTAAMNAFDSLTANGRKIPEVQLPLWDLIINSVRDRLISELSKLFDKASTGKNTNCSLEQLKEIYMSSEYDEASLVQAIDDLYKQYEALMPVDQIRNKKVAHHDLNSLKDKINTEINMENVNELAEGLSSLYQKSNNILSCIEIPTVSDVQPCYERAIDSMLGINGE